MQIWIDADACPVVIKEILYRAARRTRTRLTLIANQGLQVPASEFIRAVQVPRGFDVADNEIVRRLENGDLVITADIALAAEVLAKGAHALNPRGERYDPGTIAERLAMRDMMESLRSSGIDTGGPATFGPRDQQRFAGQLDSMLAKLAKSG